MALQRVKIRLQQRIGKQNKELLKFTSVNENGK